MGPHQGLSAALSCIRDETWHVIVQVSDLSSGPYRMLHISFQVYNRLQLFIYGIDSLSTEPCSGDKMWPLQISTYIIRPGTYFTCRASEGARLSKLAIIL